MRALDYTQMRGAWLTAHSVSIVQFDAIYDMGFEAQSWAYDELYEGVKEERQSFERARELARELLEELE